MAILTLHTRNAYVRVGVEFLKKKIESARMSAFGNDAPKCM